ncbi:hypothetical protein MASR2M78_06490 [Treponema sp.]
MTVLQTSTFSRTSKKLDQNQKHSLDEAIRTLMEQALVGDSKKGDLAGIRVFKFRMNNQAMLLAYTFNEQSQTMTLIALGPHENF